MKAELEEEYTAIVDTNVLISFLLRKTSVPGQAMEKLADMRARLLFSDATYEELVTRVNRPKFDKYRDAAMLGSWLQSIQSLAKWLNPHTKVGLCRDPDDNKFLALALDGAADCIITGDKDLLVLHPFEGIPIVSPADFLKLTMPSL